MSDEALATPWTSATAATRVAQVDQHSLEKSFKDMMRELNDAYKGEEPEPPPAVFESVPPDIPARQPHWSDEIPRHSDWQLEFLRRMPRLQQEIGSTELLTPRQLEFLARAQFEVETMRNPAPLAMPSNWDLASGLLVAPPQVPANWTPTWGALPALRIPEYASDDVKERLGEHIEVIRKLHGAYPDTEPVIPPSPPSLPAPPPTSDGDGWFFERWFDWSRDADADREDLNVCGARVAELTGECVQAIKASYRDFMEAAEQLDIILRISIHNYPAQTPWEEHFRSTGRTTGPREGGRPIEWRLVDHADKTVERTAFVVRNMADRGLEIGDKIREIVDLRTAPTGLRCGTRGC